MLVVCMLCVGIAPRRYSEAVGSRELLGYDVEGHLIIHPQFGSCCYPVTIFSNAPVDVVSNLMETALHKLQVSNIINSEV